jgi:hypothetical protein
MTDIILKVRNLIGDLLITTGRDVFTYESITSSKIFTLTEANINASTIIVYKNGSVWAGTNYSYSSTTGKLTVTGTLTAGNLLEVIYSYYEKYSDNELIGFINSSFFYLSIEKYKTFVLASDNTVFPTPSENEKNLIAVIASILIKGDIVSYRTPELSVSFERGDSKEKKIKKYVRQFNKVYGIIDYIDINKTMIVNEEED